MTGSAGRATDLSVGKMRLVRIVAGKVVRRAKNEIKRLGVPVLHRLIKYPAPNAFFAADGRGEYFLRSADRGNYVEAWREMLGPEASVIEAADRVCRHAFDLLGSGEIELGEHIDWSVDFKTGYKWPSNRSLRPAEITTFGSSADIKVPWELSRFQHVSLLGRAYWLTSDEKYAHEFVSEISEWMDLNPWGLGVNWACAMDVAIRAANWVLGYAFFESSQILSNDFRCKFVRSLWEHGEFITSHLERSGINGNHYLSDLAGLFVLGVFFSATERGKHWRDFAFQELCREMRVQVLEDGVDYEKSTSYHRLVLELFTYTFLLAGKSGIEIPLDIRQRWERMFEFVAAYTRPDGSIPLIGDADDGMFYKLSTPKDSRAMFLDHRYLLCLGALIFDRPDFAASADGFAEEAFWAMGPDARKRFEDLRNDGTVGSGSRAFESAGFYIMRSEGTHAMIDAGDNGLGGLGGHSHCDLLSFDLSLRGKPFIVDSGSFVYTADPVERNRFRSTAYHNAVRIDGEEIHPISEKWLFGLPNAGDVRVICWEDNDSETVLETEHDAYCRLSQPVTHRRRVVLNKANSTFNINDYFDGRGDHFFESFLHFVPEITVQPVSGSKHSFEALHGEDHAIISALANIAFDVSPEDGWYSPSYGMKLPSRMLKYSWYSKVPCEFGLEIGPAV